MKHIRNSNLVQIRILVCNNVKTMIDERKFFTRYGWYKNDQ